MYCEILYQIEKIVYLLGLIFLKVIKSKFDNGGNINKEFLYKCLAFRRAGYWKYIQHKSKLE